MAVNHYIFISGVEKYQWLQKGMIALNSILLPLYLGYSICIIPGFSRIVAQKMLFAVHNDASNWHYNKARNGRFTMPVYSSNASRHLASHLLAPFLTHKTRSFSPVSFCSFFYKKISITANSVSFPLSPEVTIVKKCSISTIQRLADKIKAC